MNVTKKSVEEEWVWQSESLDLVCLYVCVYIYIYNYIMRGKKDATTFPDKPVS